MKTTRILQLLACVSLGLLAPSIGSVLDAPEDSNLAFYPDSDTLLGDIPDKRLSKFVRIGRGLSSFIRIGRDQSGLYGYPDGDAAVDGYDDEDTSAFDGLSFPEKRRLSSFVRIGRGGGEDVGDESPYSSDEFQKRGGAFIRMGKFPSSAMLRQRNGIIHSIARQPYYRRSGRFGQSSFIRIGKRDTTDALERMANQEGDEPTTEEYRRYLRIGKDLGEGAAVDKRRLSNFVRIGRDNMVQPEDLYKQYVELKNLKDKRMSKFVRIGKDGLDADKRMSKFVRIGKDGSVDDDADMQKRLSKFVRIGKASESMDKRLSQFVRIGKGGQIADNDSMDKRMSKFVRIGKGGPEDPEMYKRMSKFVRIGKGGPLNDNADIYKRLSKFVRIGKDIDQMQSDKRLSSFVRIGKSPETYKDISNKRLSSFVRIGKSFDESDEKLNEFGSFDDENKTGPDHDTDNSEDIIDGINSVEDITSDADSESLSSELNKRALSKFVRIGKAAHNMKTELADMDKRLSSFVRIGRSADADAQKAEVISDTETSK